MPNLAPEVRKRKVLTLPRERTPDHPTFVPREQSSFMVWREGGDMPKRLYPDPALPMRHAVELARLNPGERFHVMRSWRVCETRESAA